MAVVDVAPFDIAKKADWQLFEDSERFARQLVPLCLLFADREQTDARPLDGQHPLGIDVAHDGELRQVLYLAVDIGPHIQQDGWPSRSRRHDRSERGPVHARDRAKHHLGRGHGGAGIAGSKEAGHGVILDQLQSQPHGTIRLLAQRRRGLVVHGNPFRRMDDLDRQLVEKFAQRYACIGS